MNKNSKRQIGLRTQLSSCKGGFKASYPIEENPFESIVVDITNRCNMDCNFCYSPVRIEPDMLVEHFRRVCAGLPFPVAMKFAGGEPTLHPDLQEMIRIAEGYGHTVYIASNGLRYADPVFMDSLKKLREKGSAFCLGLSMDGGYSNRHVYEVINNKDCLRQKLDAFDSLISGKIGRVCLTAMIVRGVNEDVIPQLIELAKKHSDVIRYIHFRNAAKVGRWQDNEPYSIHELKALVAQHFSEDEFKPACIGEVHCLPEDGRECCYRFRPAGRLQVSIIGFGSEQSKKCPKRGRLLSNENRIQQYFESME